MGSYSFDKKRAVLLMTSFIVLGILIFISGWFPTVVLGNDYVPVKTCKIGIVLPLSGEFAYIGHNLLNAVKLSANQIKKEKGIKFDLVVRDDKNDPAEAEKIAEELVRESDILGIIGHYYSSTAMGATKIYNDVKIPVLCVYASDPKIGQSSKYVFGMNYSNKTQGEYMAVYLKKVFGKDNILVINNNNSFGVSLKEHFLNKANKLGLKIFKHLEYDHAQKFGNDFIASRLPDKEANKNIGAVVIFSHSDSGINLVKQVRAHNIDAIIMGPNSWATDKFIDDKSISEKYTRNVYITSPFLWEIGNYRAFRFLQDFEAEYGQKPDISAPMCYDAILLFASAIGEKGGDREKIKDYFASLTWQASVAGITGNLFFDQDRMMNRDVFMSEIKDGRFKVGYVQIAEPQEAYVFREKEERLKKGYLIESDGRLYHWVDVVFVGVDFFRINDVNTAQMTFDAEFYLWFKWMSDKVDVSHIDILNTFSGTPVLLREDLSKPVKYRCLRYKGTYITPYDLSKFPFDSQYLPLTLGHRSKNSTHLMLVTDARHMTHNPVKEIFPHEWVYVDKTFNSGLHRFDSTFGDPDYRMGTGYKSKIYFSTITIGITLKRILFPYIFNTFLPLFTILAISIFISRIPAKDTIRSSMTMTALLSVFVYHLAQKGSLPRVGYLMKVDYYFVIAYLFMIVLMLVNIASMKKELQEKNEDARKIDVLFAFGFVPVVIIAYVILTVYY